MGGLPTRGLIESLNSSFVAPASAEVLETLAGARTRYVLSAKRDLRDIKKT